MTTGFISKSPKCKIADGRYSLLRLDFGFHTLFFKLKRIIKIMGIKFVLFV